MLACAFSHQKHRASPTLPTHGVATRLYPIPVLVFPKGDSGEGVSAPPDGHFAALHAAADKCPVQTLSGLRGWNRLDGFESREMGASLRGCSAAFLWLHTDPR